MMLAPVFTAWQAVPASFTPRDLTELATSLTILVILARASYQLGGMTEAVRDLKETFKSFTDNRATADALMAIMRVEIAEVRTQVREMKDRAVTL